MLGLGAPVPTIRKTITIKPPPPRMEEVNGYACDKCGLEWWPSDDDVSVMGYPSADAGWTEFEQDEPYAFVYFCPDCRRKAFDVLLQWAAAK